MYGDRPGTSGIGPVGAGGTAVDGCGRTASSRADWTTSLRPRRRPSTAAPPARTASEPAEMRKSRRDDAPSTAVVELLARRPARNSHNRPNSVPMPATVERRAAKMPVAVEPSGFSRYDQRPTAPNTTKPATPIHHRRTDALPTTAPTARQTITMPVTSAALSLVPNSSIAKSFNDAAKRSMNCVPTDEIRDGPLPAMPQTSSLTARATPAATTPAMAPSVAVAAGPAGGGDGSALSGGRSVATAMVERYARTRLAVL